MRSMKIKLNKILIFKSKMVEGLNRKDILGEICYNMVSKSQAIVNIKIEMSALKFAEWQAIQEQNSMIFIIIDRSGSMHPYIE